MGLFDFLNPKKKIEKLLQEKVMGQVMEKAKTLIKEKGEEKAREELKGFAASKIQEQANSVIPAMVFHFVHNALALAPAVLLPEAFGGLTGDLGVLRGLLASVGAVLALGVVALVARRGADAPVPG